MTVADWIVLACVLAAVARLAVAVLDCFCGIMERKK